MRRVLAISFLATIVLTGCSLNNNTDSKQSNDLANVVSKRKLDFVRPEEEPNLRGLVKSIVGNEVTILELDMPNREQLNQEQDSSTDNEDSQAPVAGFGATTGMRPGGGFGVGDRTREDMGDDDILEMMKSRSTGQANVVIPVGIKMLKNEDGEMVEANLLDISANQMLMIWTNKDIQDRNVAEFVLIN